MKVPVQKFAANGVSKWTFICVNLDGRTREFRKSQTSLVNDVNGIKVMEKS